MISISFNGGNSGGPLLLDGKVIGICTATVSDSEALGLAGPIYQIVRFFRHYADYDTEYSNPLLLTPSWGIDTIPTTRDYLECNGIDPSIQGCRLSKILEDGAMGKASLRERDILMGIGTTNEKGRTTLYNIGKSPPCAMHCPPKAFAALSALKDPSANHFYLLFQQTTTAR